MSFPLPTVEASMECNPDDTVGLKAEKHTESSYTSRDEVKLYTDMLVNVDESHSGLLERQHEFGRGKKARWSSLKVSAILAKNVFSLFLIGLFVAVTIIKATHRADPGLNFDSICLTPSCVLAASEIIQNISPNLQDIDPCVDFRAYVCEGWDLKHDLREDQSDVFVGTIMAENSQLLLRHVLEAPIAKNTITVREVVDEENFNKIHDAYSACLKETEIKKIGSSPLLNILLKIEELFPASRPDQRGLIPSMELPHQKSIVYEGENELSNTMAYLMDIGVDTLVSFDIQADDKDPDAVVIFLTAPRQPGLPTKEYYNNTNTLRSYTDMIGQVLEGLLKEATPNTTTNIDHEKGRSPQLGLESGNLVRSLVEFETELAAATPSQENAEDVTKYYNPRTLEETSALLPQISIQYLIQRQAPGFTPDKIIVGSPSYLKAVSTILQNASKETIQAYLVWKTVQAYGKNIEDEAVKPLLRFKNQLLGKDPEASEERWRTCVKHVDSGLGWILSKFYAEAAFSEAAKDFGDHIVSDIKSQFIKKLGVAHWMSKDVRRLGIEKVHNIVQKIGYPQESPDIYNSTELRNYYGAVDISDLAYFNNALSMTKFDIAQMWAKLGRPTDRNEWGMTVPTVNAYYSPAGNEIVFPAGIMQSPVFYDPSVPQYLSYGAFGSVAGHELSHAFDSTGRHYDQNGNFTGWWDSTTIENFQEKAQCFVDQYHNYTVPGPDGKPLHVNGLLTLGENIADAGGLSASFAAWKAREAAHPSQLLPGLQNFPKEQLFFMSYGNWWCGKTRNEEQINRIYSDPHSPTFARILGTMANSREFRRSFSCPQREPTCELW